MLHAPAVRCAVCVKLALPRLLVDFTGVGLMYPGRRYTILGTDVIVKQATPRGTVLLERLIVPQPVLKFPRFRDPSQFITVLTKARHWTVFWARLIQSHKHPSFLLKMYVDVLLSAVWSSEWALCFRSVTNNSCM